MSANVLGEKRDDLPDLLGDGISLLGLDVLSAQLTAYERMRKGITEQLVLTARAGIDLVRQMEQRWRTCCDLVASERTAEAHALRPAIERSTRYCLDVLQRIEEQVRLGVGLTSAEVPGSAELAAARKRLERFRDVVLPAWTAGRAGGTGRGALPPVVPAARRHRGAAPGPGCLVRTGRQTVLTRGLPMSRRGRIVWVEPTDPQGRNPKCRPPVIVTPTEDIRPDGDVWVVGISTWLEAAPPEVQVELPWHSQKHPRTGLRERCAALCTWLAKVPLSAIQSEAGDVPGPLLARILSLVGNLPGEETNPPTPPSTSPTDR